MLRWLALLAPSDAAEDAEILTALELIANHDHVIVLDGDTTTTSVPAIRRILGHARPIGTSTDAWQTLTAAAARTLATVKRS